MCPRRSLLFCAHRCTCLHEPCQPRVFLCAHARLPLRAAPFLKKTGFMVPAGRRRQLTGRRVARALADREKGSNRSGAGGFKWLPAWIGCCPSSLSVSVQRHAYQGGTGDRHVNVSGRHFHKQVQVFVVVPALLSRALSTGSHTVSLRPLSPPGGRLLLRRGGDGQRELEHAFETRGPCMKAQHEFA